MPRWYHLCTACHPPRFSALSFLLLFLWLEIYPGVGVLFALMIYLWIYLSLSPSLVSRSIQVFRTPFLCSGSIFSRFLSLFSRLYIGFQFVCSTESCSCVGDLFGGYIQRGEDSEIPHNTATHQSKRSNSYPKRLVLLCGNVKYVTQPVLIFHKKLFC